MSRDDKNIDDFFFNSLSEYKEEPSPAVKQAIKAKIKPYSLLKLTSLNTILIVVGLLAITTTAFYMSNNENKAIANNTENSIITNIENKSIAENSLIENNNSNQSSKNTKAENTQINQSENINNENKIEENNAAVASKKDFSNNNKIATTKEHVVENNIESKNTNALNINDNSTNNSELLASNSSNKKSMPLDLNTTNNNSLIDQNTKTSLTKAQFKSPELLQNNITKTSTINDLNNISFVSPKSINMNENSMDWADTIGKDYLGQPIVQNGDWNSIEFYYSPFYHYSLFDATNSENSSLSSLLKELTQETWSQSHGVSLIHQEKNWFFQIGLSYIEYNQKFRNNNFVTNPHDGFNLINSGNPWDFTSNGNYYSIDTIGSFTHYTYIQDSIIHIKDSSLVYLTDTSLVSMFDTMQVVLYDTIKEKSLENKVSYYEIPFHFGYEINKGSISYALKGGLYVGIIRKTSGYQIAHNNNSLIVENQDKYYSQFTYSFSVSLGLTYHINEYFGIIVEPYYRRNINSIFNKDYPVSLKYNSTGLKLGLKYNF